ncbi:MAG: GNAT family N-acetyltransferase [Actinoplanes sp.]
MNIRSGTLVDVTDLDPAALLAAYDSQLRVVVPEGTPVERDGPLFVLPGYGRGTSIKYVDLGGLTGAALEELIARQRARAVARGSDLWWKIRGHDRPADLGDRLAAAGFRPGRGETVMVGSAQARRDPVLPDGVRLREVHEGRDVERICAMEERVWGESRAFLAKDLRAELESAPEGITIVMAEAGGEVVSAGWQRYVRGARFATLWGGSTLPEWRVRGIYRALVAYRARTAAARGYALLQVNASEASRPILEQLGFVAITTTVPYVFRPTAD